MGRKDVRRRLQLRLPKMHGNHHRGGGHSRDDLDVKDHLQILGLPTRLPMQRLSQQIVIRHQVRGRIGTILRDPREFHQHGVRLRME